MSEPVKLSAVAGTAMTNQEVADWLHLWAHHIENNSRQLRNLVLVAESAEGELGVVAGGRPLDKARLTGLMHMATDIAAQAADDEKAGFLMEDIPK